MWNHNTELQVHDGETMLLKHNDLSRGILRIKRWLELEASESLLFMLQNSEYKLERLAIDPLEVRFPFEVDRDVSCVLQLTNRSPDFVAFTALANQSRYRTVPDRGVHAAVVQAVRRRDAAGAREPAGQHAVRRLVRRPERDGDRPP